MIVNDSFGLNKIFRLNCFQVHIEVEFTHTFMHHDIKILILINITVEFIQSHDTNTHWDGVYFITSHKNNDTNKH